MDSERLWWHLGNEERDLDGKVKHLQDLLKFMISFIDSNGEQHKDVEHDDQGETLQQQKKTVAPPFNSESTGTKQHQLPWMVSLSCRYVHYALHERARQLPWPYKSIKKGL